MNTIFFVTIFIFLQILCFFVARRWGKTSQDTEDYLLAKRSMGTLPLAMTFIATQIGGGMILGSAETAFTSGLSACFYPLGAAVGMLLLSFGVGEKMAKFPAKTVTELLEIVYQSVRFKKFASLLSMACLFLIFIAQIVASRKFMLSFGVDNNFLFALLWLMVIGYTAYGGMRSVVATDVLQAAFFIGVFAICFFSIASNQTLPTFQEITNASEALDIALISKLFLMPLLFMLIEQDMGQRCFSARSGVVIKKAAFIAAITTLVVTIIPISLGFMARGQAIATSEGASVFMQMIARYCTPEVTALGAAAILAAIVSTANSLLQAVVCHLAVDFSLMRNKVSLLRLAVILLGAVGFLLSMFFSSIVGLLMIAYELFISALFVPTIFAIMGWRASRPSAYVAAALGSCAFLVQLVFPLNFPRELITLAVSFSGFYLTEYYIREKQVI